jgi:hypothetical protein
MQAARRTWRLGQTQPVAVWYVVYRDTMEYRAATLIGQKLAAAKLLYGDAVEGALIQTADVGRGLLTQLTRDAIDGAPVVDLHAYFRKAAHAGNGNGKSNGHAADDVMIQPAPRVAVPVMPLGLPELIAPNGNGNGHADNGNGHPAPRVAVPVMPLTLPLAHAVTGDALAHAGNGDGHAQPVSDTALPLTLPLVPVVDALHAGATDALAAPPRAVVVKPARQLALF